MFNSGVRGKRANDNTGTLASQTQYIQQKNPQPSITSWRIQGTDDTALNPAGGQTVLVNGTGFASGAAVTVNGITISPVTVVSPTQLSFTSTALAGGSYSLIVYNSTGGAAILVPGLIYSAVPTWTTAAGSIGTYYETIAINSNVVATSDSAITYSLSSGSLPSGATLYGNGVITGTSPVESGSTTYTFAIKAEDQELQDTTRTFTLTINTDVVTWSAPANGTTYTANINEVASNVVLSATSAAGYGITYSANALPTGLSLAGNTILGTPTVVGNSATLLTATASTTNRNATRTINWVVQLGQDPFFYATTLLLNGETSSTYWIQDASTNGFAVTVNGDTRPTAFSPYETVWSNFFDGTGDYLASSASFATSNNWTVEAWCYFTGAANNDSLLVGIPERLYILWLGSTLYVGDSSINNIVVSNKPINQWFHIAVVKNGANYTAYINGSSVGTSSSALISETITTWHIGARVSQSQFATGYISNVRIVNGTAVYTANFTPPTSPLTAIANTSLLTCQSNRLIDNSTNNFTITKNGDVTVSNFGPFTETDVTTGSGYFDGTGDWLTLPSNSNLLMGSGNFTIEYWIYFTSVSATNESYNTHFSYGGSGNTIRVFTFFANGNYFLDVWTGATQLIRTVNDNPPISRWAHVAIVRNGSTLTAYLNGAVVNSVTNTTDFNAGTLTIGSEAGFGSITGHISNFRAVKGTAVYTSAFTPPTSPLTAIANTSLLTLQSRTGENNNRFVDNSGINNILTRNGNTTQGTFSPYSQTGWSVSFNASNDNVVLSSTTSLNIESVDFTIEAWIYMNVMPTATSTTNWSGDWAQWFIIYERSNGGTTGWQFRVGATLLTLGGDGDNSIAWGTHGMTTNTWYHVAVSRASSTYRIFVNGSSLSLTTQAVSMATLGSYYIGSEDTSGANFNGFISNLRVIKGQAIYTGAFTPSTTPLTPVTIGSTGAGAAASLTGLTSLLTCNISSFIDSSANRNSISRSGTNTVVTAFSAFTPAIVTPTSYSAFFDGTGDFLTIPDNSSFGYGTGDFTIEFWLNPNSTGLQTVVSNLTSASSTNPHLYISSTIRYFTASADRITGASLVTGQWYHIALCRNSGSTRLFVNGTQSGSTYSDTNNYGSSAPFGIGTYWNGGTPVGDNTFSGYISNLRILKGTGLYTSAFTPPTSPLTAIANTSLLTCQSSTFIDNSTSNFTIIRNGDAASRSVNPFGNTSLTGINAAYSIANVGGSMYFDGTGDFLTIGTSTNLALGAGDFTVEIWLYLTAYNGSLGVIFDWRTAGSSPTNIPLFSVSSSGVPAFWQSVSLGPAVTGSSAVPRNAWAHLAVVRNGLGSNNLTMYLNGTSIGSATATNSLGIETLRLNDPQGSFGQAGYFSSARIVKGRAVYTSNFAPPVAPLTPIANTILLLSGSNSGLIDYTSKNILETVGNTQLSVSVKKFGSSSMYFDGSGDFVQLFTSNQTLSFRTGNFTVECWVYFNTSGQHGICQISTNPGGFNASTSNSIGIQRSATGQWEIYAKNTNTQGNATINQSQWYHVALVRSGTTTTFYVNGTSLITVSADTTDYTGTYIGLGAIYSTAVPLNGYIDDFRVTTGVARYTSNFTPPTQAFITF